MAYIINNTRGNLVATVADGTVDTFSVPITLVGRGVTPYGLYENENYVYLLENFCGPTAPGNPMQGQLWFDSVNNRLSVRSVANTWLSLASESYVQGQVATVFNSPALTGVPTAPTATVGTNTTQIATTQFVQSALSAFGTGNTSISGNIVIAGLATAANFSSVGNITAGGFISAVGDVLTSGRVSAAGNIIGGNILTSGQISAVGNITTSGTLSAATNITTSGGISAVGNIVTGGGIVANTIYANNIVSTGTPTTAFRIPNLTQSQINALTSQNGDMVYNTSINLPQIYQDGQWNNFTVSYYS